jgi:hypothetical protein
MSNPPQFNLFACGDSFLEDSGTEETCISEWSRPQEGKD